MRVRVVFLPDCPLILSPHKHRSVWVFLNKKNEEYKQGSPLNSSIDIYKVKYITQNNISPLSNCCLSSSPPSPPLFLNISLTTMNKPKTQHNHHSNPTTPPPENHQQHNLPLPESTTVAPTEKTIATTTANSHNLQNHNKSIATPTEKTHSKTTTPRISQSPEISQCKPTLENS